MIFRKIQPEIFIKFSSPRREDIKFKILCFKKPGGNFAINDDKNCKLLAFRKTTKQ